MSFTNSTAILTQIQTDLTTANLGITINLDEPLELVYDDLPSISIYPLREEFIYDGSYNQDKKQLAVRVELRMKGSPASSICTPIMNTIASAIKADRTLNGLADYVELQSLQWANDITEKGYVCASSLDLQIDYLI